MLVFRLYFLRLSFLITTFCACSSPSQQGNGLSKETIISSNSIPLPFFNQPDWTPEWIKPTEARYAQIHTIPPFSFLNQLGATVTEKTVTGKIYIANFFFTRCKNICPKMTDHMNLLQAAYKKDKEIVLISHSVMPETDSISVLKQYGINNKVDSSKWFLLTGAKSKIYALAKQQYFAGDTVGYYQTGNEFLHTENFILVDKHRRIRGVYNGTLLVEINRIQEDIATLKKEN